MLRLMLDNLRARKFRLLSTALSVVIGVGFLVGSLVLIDTIERSFDDLFADVNAGVDARVRSADAIETDFVAFRGRIDDDVIELIGGVPGVAEAVGGVAGYAQLVDPDGDAMGNPGQGAPTLGLSWTDVTELNPLRLEPGSRPPRAAGEVVIDAKSAKDGPFAIGDVVTILLQGPPRTFEIVGTAKFGTADSPLGASLAVFDLGTAQEVLAEPGRLDSVDVVATDGTSQAELRERIAEVLPEGLEVITGEELITESQNDVADALGFFNTFMLVFAAIALFVASFIIYNTFSILVAQRTRETALLRALGARRAQILGATLLEAVSVGLLAAVIGLGAGVAVAIGLRELLAAVGLALPGSGLVFSVDTVVWAVVVGVGVTSVAATVPSRRASRVAPLAALRSTAVDESAGSKVRLVIGAGMLVMGATGLSWGLFGSPPSAVAFIGLGMLVVFLSLAVLGPVVARPFAAVVGLPFARLGVPGELARENAMRNPRRTSTTAAALMIGVGLVGTISIFAASAKASINRIIDDSFIGDLVIDSGTYGFGGLSPELARELGAIPGVEAASGVRLGFGEIDGEVKTIYGVDPATMGSIVDVGVLDDARIEDLGGADLAVHEDYAIDNGLAAGDSVAITFAETGARRFTVALLYQRDELAGDFFMANEAYEANFGDVFDFQVYVKRDPGADPDEVRTAVETAASKYANAEVQDLDEYKQSQADQIDQFLNLVYALLGLAVFIALIGIANTLALSIIERTRELGLLRAVGMTRRQLRRSIRIESVLIALLGTTLGALVGLFFGWAMVRALRDEGFSEFVLPTGQLVVIVLVAVVASVVAALQPSRRAARLDVLRAIAAD